jgi:hypothetical protein
MEKVLTVHETSVITSGRKKNINSEAGEFWDAVSVLPNEQYNTLVIQYNTLEDSIDAETLGTNSAGDTFLISVSADRPKPELRK